MSVVDKLFPNDPNMDDGYEHATNLYVAGLLLAAMAFLIAVKKGLGPGTAI